MINNMLKHCLVLGIALVGLSACVSQSMQSFEDNDIRDVLDYYGLPNSAYDTGDGYRAFEWNVKRPYVTPPMSLSDQRARGYDTSPWFQPNTPLIHNQLERHYCVYTMMARYQQERQIWVVRRYVAPALDCVER